MFTGPPGAARSGSLAGGAAGGAYAATAEAYAATLREFLDIAVDVQETAGSVEQSRAREVASGRCRHRADRRRRPPAAKDDSVRSIGAVFYEPLWVSNT